MADIAFLHTSPVHVATFDVLLKELSPQRSAVHHVREDLLACAQRYGIGDAVLIAAVRTALQTLATEARVVVCTCSTIGGLVDAAQPEAPHAHLTRIDRAMADAAVNRRAPVLTVAALQSTLRPTAELLQSSADRLGLPLSMHSLWVQDAWPHFEAGRREDYLQAIATAVRRAATPGQTVVLAQASMAGAAEGLAGSGLVVLSSPRLGVQHALQLCVTKAS